MLQKTELQGVTQAEEDYERLCFCVESLLVIVVNEVVNVQRNLTLLNIKGPVHGIRKRALCVNKIERPVHEKLQNWAFPRIVRAN